MRLVVLLSGSGSNFQAVLDAAAAGRLPDVQIVAVGSDVPDAYGLTRAHQAGLETFVVDWSDHPDRAAWTHALKETVDSYTPDYVLSSGLMRIVGEEFVDAYTGRFLNTHPALLPSFPGAHAVRDAMAYGVKITGTTLHEVDAGVDTGRILEQRAVAVEHADTEETLHERIKVAERAMIIDALERLSTTAQR